MLKKIRHYMEQNAPLCRIGNADYYIYVLVYFWNTSGGMLGCTIKYYNLRRNIKRCRK